MYCLYLHAYFVEWNTRISRTIFENEVQRLTKTIKTSNLLTWKLTHFSSKSTLGHKSSIYPKIHIFKIAFFTKFTILKYHFSQNSHVQSLIFHNIHIFKIAFFTKFTFFKHHILGNFWIKSWFLPQCGFLFHTNFPLKITISIGTLYLLRGSCKV